MSYLIIKEAEKEALFFALYSYLFQETGNEVNYSQSEVIGKRVEAIRKVVEKLALDLGFDKKYCTDEWITIGITKFTSREELEKILKKFPRGDILSEIHRQKLKYFIKKIDRQQPTTPEAILRTTSSQFEELNEEAKLALNFQNNPKLYREKLIQRAALIADLPDKIREALERGEIFPKEELNTIDSYSKQAREAIEENTKRDGTILLSALLMVVEPDEIDNPNLLEELIARVYPPRKK